MLGPPAKELRGNVTEQFLQYLAEDPQVVCDDVRQLLVYMRNQSNIMTQLRKFDTWLINLIDSERFTHYYARYISLLIDLFRNSTVQIHGSVVSNFIDLQVIVWNLTDKTHSFCLRLINRGVHQDLFHLLQLSQLDPSSCLVQRNIRHLVHSSLGVLHNLVRDVPTIRSWYREVNGISILSRFLADVNWNTDAIESHTLEYFFVLTAVLLVLSFLVTESENKVILANDAHFVYLLKALDDALGSETLQSKKYGYGAGELLLGLQNLAGPDPNKEALIRNGAISRIEKVLRDEYQIHLSEKSVKLYTNSTPLNDTQELTERALELLWCLSFVPDCIEYLSRDHELRDLIERISEDQTWPVNLQKAARGIRWNFNRRTLVASVCPLQVGGMMTTEHHQSEHGQHLMISYKHSTQDMMLKVRDGLRRLGYTIWMDVEHMHGSFVDAMAEGVEQAAGMILGISQAFKNSPHCRQEVMYAYHLKIPLFPVQLEANFFADGWLRYLLAPLPYVPLTDESMLPTALATLKEQLGELGIASERNMHNLQSLRSSKRCTPERFLQCTNVYSREYTNSTMNKNIDESEYSQARCGTTVPSLDLPPAARKRTLTITTDAPQTVNVCLWSKEEIREWLDSANLSAYHQAFATMDGQNLMELARMRLAAPNSLCELLKKHFRMKLTDQLRLFVALNQISSRQ